MALPVVIQAIRWTHILAGFTAFFIAPVPLLTAKGGQTHRRWGKIYFWAMAVVAITAMVPRAVASDPVSGIHRRLQLLFCVSRISGAVPQTSAARAKPQGH
jgi:uncharacterized membrane protein